MTTTFLDEESGLREIRQAISSSSVSKIAVAFWGRGAVDMLGLAQPTGPIKVICNLDSGACNPSEVRKLSELPHVEVRTHAQLHAKVYWTPGKVVIGSSNASANGLAVETPRVQGWLEANALLIDPSTISAAEIWFDSVFNESRAVDEEILTLAETVWRQRKSAAPTGKPLTSDLIQTFLGHPDRPVWDSVRLVISRNPVELKGLKARLQELPDAPKFRGMEPYQNVSELIKPGDWLIDFDYTGRTPKFTGYWHAPEDPVTVDEYMFTHKSKWIELPGLGRLTMSDHDRARISSLADKFLDKLGFDDDDFIAAPIRNVIEVLAEVQNHEPKAVSYLDALQRAGLQITSARGLWGGVTSDGVPVVTSWTDSQTPHGYKIWKPQRNFAGLKKFWEAGEMAPGTAVRFVLLTPKGNSADGGASIQCATVMAGEWAVSKFLNEDQTIAEIVPYTGGE